MKTINITKEELLELPVMKYYDPEDGTINLTLQGISEVAELNTTQENIIKDYMFQYMMDGLPVFASVTVNDITMFYVNPISYKTDQLKQSINQFLSKTIQEMWTEEPIITKELFMLCMKSIRHVIDFEDGVRNILCNYDRHNGTDVYYPKCVKEVQELLELVMDDTNELIFNFIWENEFGRAGDAPISTVEELWDKLVPKHNLKLTKTQFIQYVKSLQSTKDFKKQLNDLCAEQCLGFQIDYPECSLELLILLEKIMGDNTELITDFCYEYDFGWAESIFISIHTVEDLWNTLTRGGTN